MAEHDQDSRELEQAHLEEEWKAHVRQCNKPIAACAPCAGWFGLERHS